MIAALHSIATRTSDANESGPAKKLLGKNRPTAKNASGLILFPSHKQRTFGSPWKREERITVFGHYDCEIISRDFANYIMKYLSYYSYIGAAGDAIIDPLSVS